MTAKAKPVEEFRMSAKEFDRILGQALRVKPETTGKAKRPRAKTPKNPRKK